MVKTMNCNNIVAMGFLKRAFSDEAVSLIAMCLRLGSGALLLPVLLRTIPSKDLGIWYVFLSAGSIGPIFDLGFSATLARFSSMYAAGATKIDSNGLPSVEMQEGAPNVEGLSELYSVSRRIYGITSLVIIAILALLAPCVIFSSKDASMRGVSYSLEWWLFVVVSGTALYAQFANTMLRGMGRIAVAQTIQIVSVLLYLIVVSTMVLSGWGLKSLIAGMFASNFSNALLSRVVVRRLGVRTSARPSYDLFKQMVPNSLRMGAIGFGSYLIMNANVLLCGKFLTLNETASLGLSNQLAGILMAAASVFVGVKVPLFTQIAMRRQFEDLKKVFYKAFGRGVLVFIVGMGAILFLGPLLLDFIGSNTKLLPFPLMLVFLLTRFLEFNHGQYAALVMSGNCIPFVWQAILAGVLIFSVGFFVVSIYGMWGLVLTTMIVQLIVNNWYPVFLGFKILNLKNDATSF